ncbi:hypothetical protein I553_0064 [Mycobacterium xenopi 4042]|uniref:Uncharacterized protein n=1 Tax=Mycobacterium xenopi 4042 TaxID=1299334 RepID=X8BKX1_MYCXE|nr:hypothetical protein I553_0064 [Mycobacterium xenopi 4042]
MPSGLWTNAASALVLSQFRSIFAVHTPIKSPEPSTDLG